MSSGDGEIDGGACGVALLVSNASYSSLQGDATDSVPFCVWRLDHATCLVNPAIVNKGVFGCCREYSCSN